MEWIARHMHGTAMRDAAEMLAWRGYEKVQAWELARAARVSVGTMYRQYGNKRNFALEVRRFTEQELCLYAETEYGWAYREGAEGFRAAFGVFWRALAWAVRAQPGMFCFTFVHWHPEDLGDGARGGQARALVNRVLTEGEREGALAAGSAKVGESLVWGALRELARTVAQGTEVMDEDVLATGEALLRALETRSGCGPRGSGHCPPEASKPPDDGGPPREAGPESHGGSLLESGVPRMEPNRDTAGSGDVVPDGQDRKGEPRGALGGTGVVGEGTELDGLHAEDESDGLPVRQEDLRVHPRRVDVAWPLRASRCPAPPGGPGQASPSAPDVTSETCIVEEARAGPCQMVAR
jgi:AcrR family transcriptional regulator